jgi:hypothetical protein
MATGKKSFILYTDLIHTVNKLPNDKAGELLKHILSYVNDQNPTTEDLILQLVFEPIKQQLKRDLIRWEKYIKKQSNNGKKGGRPKTQINPNKAVGYLVNPKKPSQPKKADNVNVNVSVNDNDNVNVKKENNIIVRKQMFADSLKPFLPKYGKDFLNDFFAYWTEPNKSNSKFRQELQKTWSLNLRLETWAKNNKQFGNSNGQTKHPIVSSKIEI